VWGEKAPITKDVQELQKVGKKKKGGNGPYPLKGCQIEGKVEERVVLAQGTLSNEGS